MKADKAWTGNRQPVPSQCTCVSLHVWWMVVEAHVASVGVTSFICFTPLPDSCPSSPQSRSTPVLGHKDKRLTLHKTTTLKTAGPDLPGEIAHCQSHGLTVEKCRGEGGWRMGFVKWNKGHTPVGSYQCCITPHDLYTVWRSTKTSCF